MDKIAFAKYIDHTNLKADATKKDIEKLCTEALQYNFHSICINSSLIEFSSHFLQGSGVGICTVVGFPLGASISSVKAKEAYEAVNLGADEIDMVINIGDLKANNKKKVLDDIKYVLKESYGKIVKVIIETCYLTEDEKIAACLLSKEAGAHFVKTSTGFGSFGATISDIKLMKEVVGESMKIKAAGGIKDYATALNMINAGASRLGLSSSVEIIESI